ncbi:MAG: penicillin-binding protein 2 [Thermoleophilia bacterium]|nr:penicillin-binding protein 2 [Thermoleophilia bacterium]
MGLAGLEKEYDAVLSGLPGSRDIVGDPFGRSLDVVSDAQAEQGQSIVSTIDEDIQYAAEQTLKKVVEDFKAKRAMAVVMEPATGEVLAMANAPLFDTGNFGQVDEQLRRNSVIVDQYEPGSTFKIVTMAAALEAGLVTPETRLRLKPTIRVWDRTVRESHRDQPAVRDWSVTQILAQSSNVGTVMIAQQVGEEGLEQMIRRFGFVQKTDIDFPGEAAGLMPPLEEWSGSTIGNIPIGQGISVTPLQLATAYAVIANNGVYVKPHLVRTSNRRSGERSVVSPEVAGQLKRMLRAVVQEGTGQAAAIEGYAVAGKTGTAQKIDPETRRYSSTLFLSSFAGMIPVEAPRLVVLVVVDEPTVAYYGSSVAAPAFAEIADFALKHLEIPPSTGELSSTSTGG